MTGPFSTEDAKVALYYSVQKPWRPEANPRGFVRSPGALATRQVVHVMQGDRVKYMLQVRFNGADAVIGGLPAAERES